MTVLLAAAPHADTFGYSMPPPGLLRLGGALRARGLEVRLEDLAFRLAAGQLEGEGTLAEAAAERLLAGGAPRVLGLSTMGATLPIAVAIARCVAQRAPEVTLILGGPGTTGLDVALLERFRWLDAVVRGEGEQTLVELVERLAAGRDPAGVAGVTWRLGRGEVLREPDRPPIEDLDRLPDYAWDLLPPIATYKAVTGEEEGLVPIDSGRGCAYDCSFCTIGRFWSRRSRPLPVPRLVREIADLAPMPGARRAYLCHDIFGADRRHALELCRALVTARVDVPWECRARVDHLDEELLAAMGGAGCYRVLLGVESGDGELRNRHGKHMDPELDVLAVVEACGRHGITPILSLILGLPGEDETSLGRTVQLALDASLRTGCNLSFHLVNPQPGCGLGETHGPGSTPLPDIPPDMALGAGESPEERALIADHPDLFSSFALLTGEPGGAGRLRELHTLASRVPPVLMDSPRSFALAARRLGTDALGLARRWLAAGTEFTAFARDLGDPRVRDMLRWEAAVAAAAAGDAGTALVRAHCDLPALAAELAGSTGRRATPDPEPTCLAVVPGRRGIRTLRVSEDVAQLLERPPAELDARTRTYLTEQGLLAAPPPTSSP